MRPRPTARRANLTRERILNESARVFNRRGYHGTTLDDIARALHVTKAALYYHVRSMHGDACTVGVSVLTR